MVNNLPAMQETQVWALGQGQHLEEEMATHSSILAWEIPWIEEPGRLTIREYAKLDKTELLSPVHTYTPIFPPSWASLPPFPPSYPLGHHRALSWDYSVVQQFLLAICFTHGSIYIYIKSMPLSICPTLSFPYCIHVHPLHLGLYSCPANSSCVYYLLPLLTPTFVSFQSQSDLLKMQISSWQMLPDSRVLVLYH